MAKRAWCALCFWPGVAMLIMCQVWPSGHGVPMQSGFKICQGGEKWTQRFWEGGNGVARYSTPFREVWGHAQIFFLFILDPLRVLLVHFQTI